MPHAPPHTAPCASNPPTHPPLVSTLIPVPPHTHTVYKGPSRKARAQKTQDIFLLVLSISWRRCWWGPGAAPLWCQARLALPAAWSHASGLHGGTWTELRTPMNPYRTGLDWPFGGIHGGVVGVSGSPVPREGCYHVTQGGVAGQAGTESCYVSAPHTSTASQSSRRRRRKKRKRKEPRQPVASMPCPRPFSARLLGVLGAQRGALHSCFFSSSLCSSQATEQALPGAMQLDCPDHVPVSSLDRKSNEKRRPGHVEGEVLLFRGLRREEKLK